MIRKAKEAKNFVEEGLEKVRSEPWAEPLGKALEVSGKIVGAVESFVPGANIIGGALSFGATLLNPEPSIQDLQKELQDIKEEIRRSASQAAVRALEKEQRDLENKIANPPEEITKEFGEVKIAMKRMLKEVEHLNDGMSDQTTRMKDLISRTFQIVADIRYKVCNMVYHVHCTLNIEIQYIHTQEGIETVDNAYDVFLRNGIEDFQPYAFELQTCAAKNLNPRRIKEYLEIIHQDQGFPFCQVNYG